jgi:hypothetical protein
MRVSHPVAGGSAGASLSHRRLRTVSWPVMGNIQLNPPRRSGQNGPHSKGATAKFKREHRSTSEVGMSALGQKRKRRGFTLLSPKADILR